TNAVLNFKANVTMIGGRNGANSADRQLLSWSPSGNDALYLGGDSAAGPSGIRYNVATGSTHELRVNGVAEYQFSSTDLTMNANNVVGAGFYSASGTVATTGLFRAPANSSVIAVRRSDNGANDIVLSVDAADNFTLGDTNATSWSYAVGSGGT